MQVLGGWTEAYNGPQRKTVLEPPLKPQYNNKHNIAEECGEYMIKLILYTVPSKENWRGILLNGWMEGLLEKGTLSTVELLEYPKLMFLLG